MIHRLYCDNEKFRSIEFKKGLNIIVSEKKKKSTTKDSRNGVGKTLLLQIIDFCLGSNNLFKKKNKIFMKEIKNCTFFLDFDIDGKVFTVGRSLSEDKKVIIRGDFKDFIYQPNYEEKIKESIYDIEEYRLLLGIYLFGIPENTKKLDYLTFRSLMKYFLRAKPENYISPFKPITSSGKINTMSENSFLLGLDYSYFSELKKIKELEEEIKNDKKFLKNNDISSSKSKGKLETDLILLSSEIEKEEKKIDNFQVNDQYNNLQNRADEITRNINNIINNNVFLKKQLSSYKDAIYEEKAPSDKLVEKMYEEAKIIFKSEIKNQLAEVRNFHKTIIKNRKEFLRKEIFDLEQEIKKNQKLIEENQKENEKIFKILKSTGALEHYNLLRNDLELKKSRKLEIANFLKLKKDIEEKEKYIQKRRDNWEKNIKDSYDFKREDWIKLVNIFGEYSKPFYQKSGKLIIDCDEKGYSFDIEIEKSDSYGIGKVKVFCYDFLLLNNFSSKNKINFLCHDSAIFDGVDSRQILTALNLAKKESDLNDIQYICSFNSDIIRKDEISNNFTVDDFVVLTLKDSDPSEYLFGFTF